MVRSVVKGVRRRTEMEDRERRGRIFVILEWPRNFFNLIVGAKGGWTARTEPVPPRVTPSWSSAWFACRRRS